MKAILLAAAAEVLAFAITTAHFRFMGPDNRVGVMLKVYLGVLILHVCSHVWLPGNLGFLPDSLVCPVGTVDLGFSLFLYTAGFFGGLLQLYNLADRGLSLRILIDILESDGQCLSLDQVMRGYGGGHGMEWMYDKRIDGMVRTGLIAVGNDQIVSLTPRGCTYARRLGWLQRAVRVSEFTGTDGK